MADGDDTATGRVAILGATGRMGRLVAEEVNRHPGLQLVAAVGRPDTTAPLVEGVRVLPVGPGCFGDADVVIDFSLPEALREGLPQVGTKALVSGTTGLDDALSDALREQSTRAPVLHAANFSLGIHLLRALVRQAVQSWPAADVEIVETHHRHKQDAPSGTALWLADDVAAARSQTSGAVLTLGRHGAVGPRPPSEIGVHAIRGGDVPGTHVVHLLAEGERIALTHEASGRRTFAIGAVRAAAWVVGRAPGQYAVSHVLGL